MHRASQKEVNTQRSGDIWEFVHPLSKGKKGSKGPLTGEQMIFRKDKWALTRTDRHENFVTISECGANVLSSGREG